MIDADPREAFIWDAAIDLAEHGDASMLARVLRDVTKGNPPRRALDLAADFLDGTRKVRKRRGVASRARDHAVEIRTLYEQLNSEAFKRVQPERSAELSTQRAQFAYIGSLYNLSAETVRDVIERRKTFGEK